MVQFLLAIGGFVGCFSNPELSATDLAGIKCVVSGKPASQKYFCGYYKGRVYFDCNASKLKFESDRSKFAVKANHQLAVTSQYVQSYCPVTREPISGLSKIATPIAGVAIRFSCDGCRESMRSVKTGKDRVKYIFSPERFNSIFVPNPKLSQSRKPDADSIR